MTEQQPNQPNPNIPAWAQQPTAPPAPGWGAPTPPPKKKHTGLKIAGGVVGAVIVISIIASAASGGGSKKNDDKAAAPSATATTGQPAATPATKAAAPAPKKTHKPQAPDTVEYIVTGSPADVTYGPAGSSLSGHSPMTVKKKLGHPSYYSVSAQLSGSGTVKCEIKVKGKVVSKATASGSYQIAMCEIVQDPFGDGWTDANSS